MKEEIELLKAQVNCLKNIVRVQGDVLEQYIDFAEHKRNQSSALYPSSGYERALRNLRSALKAML